LDEAGQMIHTKQKSHNTKRHTVPDTEISNEFDYKTLFEQLDIAIWRQNISCIFSDLQKIHQSGVTDIESYLNKSPDTVLEIAMKVKILQVNSAALNMLEADSLNHLLENFHATFTDGTIQFFTKIICAIWNQNEHFSYEIQLTTLKGKTVHVLISFTIPHCEEEAHNVPFTLVDITKQIKTEQTLREKERLSTMLVENANISIWDEDFSAVLLELKKLRSQGVVDLKTYLNKNKNRVFHFASLVKVIHVNSTSLRMFEAEDEKSLIASIQKTFGPDALTIFEEELCAIWNGEERFTSEATWVSLYGRKIHGLVSFNIPRNEIEAQNVPVTIVDITDRVKAVEALKENEHRLSEAQRIAKIGHYELDHHTMVSTWSDEVYRIFEKDPDTFITSYTNIQSCFHPKDRDRVDQAFKKSIRERTPFNITHRISSKSKGEKYVSERGETVFDDNGTPLISYGTVMDITDIHTAEEKLHETEKIYEIMVDSAPDGIFLSDKQGNIIRVNRAALEISGYTEEDLLGMNVINLVPERWAAKAAKQFLELKKYGKIALEIPFIKKDSSEGISSFIGVRLSADRFLGFNKDITEEKRVEQQLHQSEKMQVIGQLAGGIAHDFNNQLGGILGFADLLHTKLKESSPELLEYTDHIIHGINRASDLTSELLAFSRKGKYRSELIDVNSLVGEVITILSHTLDKQISIHKSFCVEQATTKGDPTQIQNALLNLALNARDALLHGGTITFTTAVEEVEKECVANLQSGTYITIQISDTGTGMSKSTIEHIFEPFFTTKDLGKGTGMGLAAVYGTLQNHDGTITVESEIDKGSTFTLYLPYSDEAMPQETEKEIFSGPKLESAHILLVDDEPMLRNVASRMIKSQGFTVVTCDDGLEALDYLDSNDHSIDLVILDLVMPGLSGAETFHHIKKRHPNLNVLISSGYSIEGEAQELIEQGARGFIQKPFGAEELFQKIHEIVSKVYV